MGIFYTIHSLNWGQNLKDGQRNCRTFLCGTALYLAIYLIIKNLHINGYIGKMYDAMYSVLIVIIVADLAVMGYIYRNYFGRSILHEMTPPDQKRDGWYYDEETHTYSNQLPLDKQVKKELQKQKVLAEYEIQAHQISQEKQQRLDEITKQQKTNQIVDEKNKLRAAVKIQRWWRKHLYEPGTGVWYKKAEHSFKSL